MSTVPINMPSKPAKILWIKAKCIKFSFVEWRRWGSFGNNLYKIFGLYPPQKKDNKKQDYLLVILHFNF